MFALASSVWKSRPLNPGNLMSRTRQLATSGSLLCSISDAEPNTSTFNPTDSKRLLSALRTDASSSTTKTIGSLALAGTCDDLGRSVTTHPPYARVGRIETSRRAPHYEKPTDVPRGLPRSNGRLRVLYPCRRTWW